MSADRQRIAMLIWSYWPGHEGGAERQCRQLVPHLFAQGLQVEVWTAWTGWRHRRREHSGEYEIVRLGWLVPALMAIRRALEVCIERIPGESGDEARRQARFREALSFWLGLPVTWLARSSFVLELWLLLRRRRPDVIHVHESGWLAGAAAWLARRQGIPVLAKTATSPAWEPLGYDTPLRRVWSAARRYCRYAILYEEQAQDLLARGIPAEQIFWAPNGVEMPASAGARGAEKEVLFVANFSQSVEQKAFDVLFHAWCQVAAADPAARLLLLGSGHRAPWEAMVKNLGLEASATFIGWTPDPTEYYRRAALFVLPSRVEGMSNALLEAQSWGLACVVSDIPANRAVVRSGFNGWVVPVGDASALAAGVLRLLADPALQTELGRNARQRMREQFSMAAAARRFSNIYSQLVFGRASEGASA